MGLPLLRMWNTFLSAIDKTLGRSRVAARPLRIHIEINDYCNLKCPYCPRENPLIPKNTGNIPLESVRRLEPWIRRANYVGLAGNGEPFLHPDILEILRLVTRAGAVPSVVTNGTRFKTEHIEILPTLGPMLLMISMDGGTKKTFETWRRGASFDAVCDSLRALKAARERIRSPHPIVNFIVCLMKENIGETEAIVDLAAECGAAVVVFQPLFPYVKELEYLRVVDLDAIEQAVERARRRAAPVGIRIDYTPMSFDLDYREGTSDDPTVASMERLEKGHFAKAMSQIEAEAETTNPRGTKSAPPPSSPPEAPPSTPVAAHRPPPRKPQTEKRIVYHCDNVWQQLHVTLRGDVNPCCFWTEGVVGSIEREPLERLWNGPEWDRVRGALHRGEKPPPCRGCHILARHDTKRIWRDALREIRDLWRNRQ